MSVYDGDVPQSPAGGPDAAQRAGHPGGQGVPGPDGQAPRPARSFTPGVGLFVVLILTVVTLALALAAAVTAVLGLSAVSAVLGGLALILVGLGLLAVLRVPARSLVVNAPRLRLERRRVAAWRASHGETGAQGPDATGAGRAVVLRTPGGTLSVPTASRRELTTLDVVSGPVSTALAASALGRAADERLAGTTTGETLMRLAQLLAGAVGFVLLSLGLASVLGQVIA